RMCLAAPKVGLQLHYGIAAAAAQSLDRVNQKSPQALGDVGTAEELDRFAVLIRTLAQMNLPQVRRKLRLLIAPAGHVRMRAHHLAPRLQPRAGRSLNGCIGGLPLLRPHLLVEAHAQQLQSELAYRT